MPDFSIFIGNYLHKAKMDLHFIFLYFLNLILGVVSKDRTLFMSKRKSVKGPDAKIYDNLFLGRGIPNPEPDWNKDNDNPLVHLEPLGLILKAQLNPCLWKILKYILILQILFIIENK